LDRTAGAENGQREGDVSALGPHAGWELGVQHHGRTEMVRVLHEQGLEAARDYAAWFEAWANEWLAWNGYATGFVFDAIKLGL
jgi:hypothetical protein